ncbi:MULTISPECIES: 50S ribosomal protein L11 methyltransferase [unclassified Roseateles]|uniref:50S ribosomal protein L11 methyltransferase n=1 Tax=unclassified Roseateles TaxID=2626991 RepID=UPI0006F39CC5|nr:MULTISPECIES: 50S ribosomal protein L11 methyltransferase [unclassified Roseateles]KQW51778.1 ribosomal protein L11 methyltransferase [Pelomonas sp. Root405]KRA78011.1 ribosomal protein L11 methyltransferase [Pelomonas sp. Root662]
MSNLFELALVCREADVEVVSDALMEIDALAVSVEDADADTDAERALFGEPGMPAPAAGWERSTVKALFPSEPEATEAATLILAQDWANDVHVQAIQAVPEQDWVRLTQSQFAPVEITPEFWIVPSWHQAPPQAKAVMRLDPGLAFGTGTHPTTRMCLRWIATHVQPWTRVLDYGCGSGILAIGAALHGARDIDAVDIDPAAVTSSRDNAKANGVTLNPGLPDLARGEYPLVVANILASPLKLLAPLLCAHVAPGGDLILAGILSRQADELKAAYAPWLALEVSAEEDGWILMTARRPA